MAARIHEEGAIRAERYAAEMVDSPVEAENARRVAERERRLTVMLRKAAVGELERARVCR
jgi:hypothetical protein